MNIGKFSPKDVGLTATIGGKFGDNIRFRVESIGAPSDPETATYPLFRAALLAIVTQWSCAWADAALYVPTGYQLVSAGFSLAEKV
jgi:hypothetical protein